MRAGTAEVQNKILAAGMPHEEGLLKLMPELVMKQLGEVPGFNKQETTALPFPSFTKVKEAMIENHTRSRRERSTRAGSIASRV